MKKLKKPLSILLSLIMIFSLFTIVPFTANAAQGVYYKYGEWDESNHRLLTVYTFCSDYTVLDSNSTTLTDGWYLVKNSLDLSRSRIKIEGDVHLILGDGATLTANKGINVGPDSTLSIYSQTGETGKISINASFQVDPDAGNDDALIGGAADAGNINIHSGKLELQTQYNNNDSYHGACIGGGKHGSAKQIKIYGGEIDCKAFSSDAAAIGGGYGAMASNNDGEGIVIYGGKITVRTDEGAGIGNGKDYTGSKGSIAIYGGEIETESNLGAGIGGGQNSGNGPVNIYGGKITAWSKARECGAGIGAGEYASQKDPIRILGGTVVCAANKGAGIGGGKEGDGGEIEIANAVVTTMSTGGGAGIGGGIEGNSNHISVHSNATVIAVSTTTKQHQALSDLADRCISSAKMKMDDSAYSLSAASAISLLIDMFDPEYSGAAIGGGYYGSGGTITVEDSTVIAYCGKCAAVIGGGQYRGFDAITISNSDVLARNKPFGNDDDISPDLKNAVDGAYGAAIGTGDEAESGGGTITIKNNSDVTALAGKYSAGIGTGYKCDVTCKIDISDSVVSAEGGYCGAGVGSGDGGSFSTIDIKNSTLNAVGGDYGAGIGSGNGAEKCGTINIVDSEITAESGTDAAAIGTGNEADEPATINITGSTVTAHSGGYGAGIGGGDAVSGGTINITDSTITEADSKTDGAGIGGGEGGSGGTITITNSEVTAHGGGYAAGIGGGDDADGGIATIKNSNVKAYGGTDAAGIGGGEGGNGGKIVIEDSEVYAQGSSYGAGIGGGESEGVESVTIRGESHVTAIAGDVGSATAIGHGDYSTSWASLTQYYPSNGRLTIDPQRYFVKSGENSSNTTTYSGNDIYDACREKKYVYVYSCPHEFNEWRSINEEQHAYVCLHCGREHDIYDHSWGPDNICRVCGASAQMIDVTFVEQNNNGEEIQRTVSLPSGMEYQLTDPKNIPDGMGFVCWAITDAIVLYTGDKIVFGQCEDRYRAVYAPVTDTTYVDKDGYLQTVTARILPVSDEVNDLYTGWYVINEDIAQPDGSSYSINGDVNLILADDVTVSSNFISFYTSSHNNSDYTFTVYGQAKQTGTIFKLNSLGEFCSYVQYGGVVKTFGVDAKNCTIAGGVFDAAALSVTDSIQLGWSRWNDSITVNRYVSDSANPTVSVIAGKMLRIQSDMTRIQGELSNNEIRRITGQTLVPDVDYRFQTPPQWEWFDNNTQATATFKNLGGSDAVVNATVEHTYDGLYKISTASVLFLGEEYTDSQVLKVCWNVINKTTDSHGTVTISASTAKSNDLIKVTATPDPGYKVKSITAEPVDSYMEVDFICKDSFVMPKCDVKVTVEFEPYFAGHSLSLKGDIGVNFYCALTEEEVANGAAVDFVWTVNGSEKTHSVALTSDDKTDIGYKASCPIAVAEMTYEITATLTIGNKQVATDTYSARQYANVILKDEDFRTRYIGQTSEDKYNQLVTLVKTMLDYGSKAQIRFDRNTDDLANGGTDFFSEEVAFTSGASDMNEHLSDCGLEYIGTSVVYLTETTLRHYYRIVDGSRFTDAVKSGITFDGEYVTYGTRGDMIYYDKKDIAASQLDAEYVLHINGHDYYYSALDYSALSYSLDDRPYSESIAKQLAASVYRYNQAANVFFND